MSIRRMRQVLHERSRVVSYIIAAVFIIGLPLVFVPGSFLGKSREAQQESTVEDEVIARVGGEPLTRSQVERQFDRMVAQLLPIYASMGRNLGLEGIWQWRSAALEQAVAEDLALRKAEAERISVSRGEINERASQLADQQLSQLKAAFGPEELEARLADVVARSEKTARPRDRLSEKQFRKWMVKRLLNAPEALQRDLLLEKLRQQVVGSLSLTEQDLRASYDRATVRQLQVSLLSKRKPLPAGRQAGKRTQEEALARARQLAARARGGQDFAKLVREESDDPEARTTGGLLESVGRGMIGPAWEKAVFALSPGGISDPIEAPGGYVIVKMEKLERKLPDGFEKNKQQLMASLAQQRGNESWAQYEGKLRKEAQVEVLDPEMRAWQALQQGDQEKALSQLQEAAAGARDREGLGPAVVFYELATLLAARGQWQAAEEAYASSHDALAREERQLPGARAEALLGMARSCENEGKSDEALLWYQAASDASDAPTVHEELRSTYQKLGKQDLMAREQQWLDDYTQAQLERQKALAAERQAGEKGAAPPSAPTSAPPPETR